MDPCRICGDPSFIRPAGVPLCSKPECRHAWEHRPFPESGAERDLRSAIARQFKRIEKALRPERREGR